MKIKVFSDIHLEHYSGLQYSFDPGSGDVLILAGDILCAKHFKTNGDSHKFYRNFLETCSKNFEHILYVFGNHEFYSYNYEGAFNKIKEHLPHNFKVLENETVKIGDVNFIGFTFWTDFRNGNPLEMMEAHNYMNDYKVIRITPRYRKLNPDDTYFFHRRSKEYLINKLNELKDERVFVISHHSPTLQSIPSEFKTNSCNSAYCSDLDDLILQYPNIQNWVYGHTHNPADFYIGECRLINNAVGYPGQETGYNSQLFIKI